MHPSPYRGLAPYTESEEDAERFFGREREIRIVAANLRAARVTLLYGPSGVGKSSLLRAGLVNRLRKSRGGAIPMLVAYVNAWADDPTVAVERAIGAAAAAHAPRPVAAAVGSTPSGAPAAATAALELGHAVADGQPPAAGGLDDLLARWREPTGARVLLILDQFEEYCLYHPPGADRFDEDLPRVVARADLDVHVLLSIREDALAALDRYQGQAADLLANRLRLDALSWVAGREAIRRPVEHHNATLPEGAPAVEIEPGLEDAVLDTVAVGRVALAVHGRGTQAAGIEARTCAGQVEAAYLQLVMQALWQRERNAKSNVLRLATLEAMGGATDVVQAHVDAVTGTLSPTQQAMAARTLHFLVTSSGTKIAHTTGDLSRYADVDPERLRELLDRLCAGDAWLLRRTAPQGGGDPRYELFHDVLGPAVLDWRTRAESRRLRRRLRAVAALAVALCVALAGTLAYVADPGFVHRWEHKTVAARAGLGGPPLAPSDVVFVAFDQSSVARLGGKWPVPRAVHARMIDRLVRAGARVIAYDIEFKVAKVGDGPLHRAIGRARDRLVLAAFTFADDGSLMLFDRPVRAGSALDGVVAFNGFPLDPTQVYRSVDARVRLTPGVPQVPTFSFLAARKAGLHVAPWRDPVPIEYTPGPATTIPAADVLFNRMRPDAVRGKVVVVGTSTPAGMDIHKTPVARAMPGARIQASAILTTVSHARNPTRDIALIVALALLPLAALRLPPLTTVAVLAASAAAYLVLAQLLYAAGHILPVVVPLAVLAASSLGLVLASRRIGETRRVSADRAR